MAKKTMKFSQVAMLVAQKKPIPLLHGWNRRIINTRTPGVWGVEYWKEGSRRVILGRIKFLTQNPNKPGSQWARLAKEGHTVVQVWYKLPNIKGNWGVVVDGVWYPGGNYPFKEAE